MTPDLDALEDAIAVVRANAGAENAQAAALLIRLLEVMRAQGIALRAAEAALGEAREIATELVDGYADGDCDVQSISRAFSAWLAQNPQETK